MALTQKLDLNLLRVFDAVMAERSVRRAAQKVLLTQSAVSHALSRLRDVFADDLFVRTLDGMQPTGRALAMAPLIREALNSIEKAVDIREFDASKAQGTFTIAADDCTTFLFVPGLISTLRGEAPSVNVVIIPSTRNDLAEQIDLGRMDAAIGSFSKVPKRFRTKRLFNYDDVLLCSSSDLAEASSMALLADKKFVVISHDGEQHGADKGYVLERGLARRKEMFDKAALERAAVAAGVRIRIAATLSHSLAVPSLLLDPSMVAIVPRPLAQALAGFHRLFIHDLPCATEALDVQMIWHERLDVDAAQRFLRATMSFAASKMRDPSYCREAVVAGPGPPIALAPASNDAVVTAPGRH